MLFSEKHQIDIPDMQALYKSSHYRPRRQDNQIITVEHYYRVDLFICTVDKQLQELDSRFNEQAMELLTLGSSLLPIKDIKMFDIDNICLLVEKFYPTYFKEQEINLLRYQLELFGIEFLENPQLKDVSTIAQLCTM
ncbi:uncharacterized protein [Rutidosis leptorrhynchoides]|uniref:uncharacterized protein n=1 Tax=Rutidosis leptorrhynchoides TaxID=125765 RepID=UPI003A9970D8